jgi:hypothetical protein
VIFSGFYRSLGHIYLPNKKKGGEKGAKKGAKKDVKKATVNNPIVSSELSTLTLRRAGHGPHNDNLLQKLDQCWHGQLCAVLIQERNNRSAGWCTPDVLTFQRVMPCVLEQDEPRGNVRQARQC